MSRILFLSRRIFGQSHTIVGAGAETENGLPAARNAVIVMSELSLDISAHSSADVAGIDLEQFDLIAVFRPSAAESIDVPASCRVEDFNNADPYGESLERYRLTARLIEHSVRRLYAEDALRRISEGSTTGSHAAGIFDRAAKEFEKEVSHFATKHLGVALHKKATLGKIAPAAARDVHSRAVHSPRGEPGQGSAGASGSSSDANRSPCSSTRSSTCSARNTRSPGFRQPATSSQVHVSCWWPGNTMP